ncbi:MAG: peptidoglycan DD-metalloendopeptidase family protein [Abditibacteriota bacterium]|nr:peptidoglycan DD-metalloendopeptidase family protein [Abditibacteriota bacterium]
MKTYLRGVLICLAALMSVACVAAPTAKKKALDSKLHNVNVKIKDKQKELHEKKVEEKDAMQQLYAAQREFADKQSDVAANKIKLESARIEFDAINTRLQNTQKQLDRREDLLTAKVVDMYQGEHFSYLNVLLGSENISDFQTRMYYLITILRQDAELIKSIKRDKDRIERDKNAQAKKIENINELQTQLIEQRDEIAKLNDKWMSRLDEIENSAELMQKALNDLERESNRIEAEIVKYQNSLKPKVIRKKVRGKYVTVTTGGGYSGKLRGGLSLPCHGRFTSKFGYRVHPVTGVYKLHTGQDIAVPTGTPIKAAADGKVIMSGWMGAYGYAVVIDHGGGISTLYGHNSRLIAKRGQTVRRGEVIANAGSTGYSTGSHCHFEKRVNGRPVNPL